MKAASFSKMAAVYCESCSHKAGFLIRLSFACYATAVVCTDLGGKDLHRQLGVGIVVMAASLGGVNGSTLARNARDVGFSPTLGKVFPILITPTTLVAMTMILHKLRVVWLFNLPCVYM